MTDLNNIIRDVIEEDYNNFIKNIYQKYQYSIDLSYQEFMNQYSMKKLIILAQPSKKKYNMNLPNPEHRCMARVWGGKDSVFYDDENEKWNFGYQCSRRKNKNSDYCTIHYRQSIRSYGLSHGRVDGIVPHNHYLKYKNNIR